MARGARGIRAQDLRTLSRTAWWARRWIAALEAMRLGPRFGRGRQYAVAGQVTELELDGPHVEAVVVGSREAPYRLTLDFTAATGAARDRIASQISAEPMTLARLLTDDLPIEVEPMFRAEGVSLFPQATPLGMSADGKPVYDVKMHCSCPDWARPCKHLVAVLLLLGEEIARRPATILSLRGMDIEDLRFKIDDLRLNPTASSSQSSQNLQSSISNPQSSIFNLQSSILKRLGPIPFWRGSARCVDALARLYNHMQPVALDAANGKSIDLRE